VYIEYGSHHATYSGLLNGSIILLLSSCLRGPLIAVDCCTATWPVGPYICYPHGAHQSNLHLTHFTTRCPAMQRTESISSHWSHTTWVGATIPLNHLATPVWVALRRLQVLDLLRKLRNASPWQTALMICELRPFREYAHPHTISLPFSHSF
jgi:hypothetical protein